MNPRIFLLISIIALFLPDIRCQVCNLFHTVNKESWNPYQSGFKPTTDYTWSAGRVFISQTNGPICYTTPQCSERVRDLRQVDVHRKNMSDIGANFLIGGDGNVYEGRGYSVRNGYYPAYAMDLSLAFIGDYSNVTLSQELKDVARNFLLCGVNRGNIQYYFSVYSDSDLTCNASNMEQNGIYQEIRNWTRFRAGGNLVSC